MKHHFTLKEKADLLYTDSLLNKDESAELAKILDSCPFTALAQIAKAIKTMSKGLED